MLQYDFMSLTLQFLVKYSNITEVITLGYR